jgi:hypothetical protein
MEGRSAQLIISKASVVGSANSLDMLSGSGEIERPIQVGRKRSRSRSAPC